MKEMKKLSLSHVISKLTRNEMRYVLAGSGSATPECGEPCRDSSFCSGNSSCPTCNSKCVCGEQGS